jgi:hypothetical protein
MIQVDSRPYGRDIRFDLSIQGNWKNLEKGRAGGSWRGILWSAGLSEADSIHLNGGGKYL